MPYSDLMELSIDQVKELILFAKKERVTRLKFGAVEFELSALAISDTFPALSERELSPEQRDLEAQREAEALLYHSAGH